MSRDNCPEIDNTACPLGCAVHGDSGDCADVGGIALIFNRGIQHFGRNQFPRRGGSGFRFGFGHRFVCRIRLRRRIAESRCHIGAGQFAANGGGGLVFDIAEPDVPLRDVHISGSIGHFRVAFHAGQCVDLSACRNSGQFRLFGIGIIVR